MIKYIFFPISGIIRQNPLSSIPDHVLESLHNVIAILVAYWWWTMDKGMWEKLVVFCSATIRSGNPYSEETQLAAVKCLWELLRVHEAEETSLAGASSVAARQIRIFSTENIPLLAQILTSLLVLTSSREQSLQVLSLRTVLSIVETFFGQKYVPTVMPGIISTLSRLISRGDGNTHQRGEIVKWSFKAMQATISLGIGDDICIREGVVRVYATLEDLSSAFEQERALHENSAASESGVAIERTPSWLKATAAQLHNALNVLIPRVIDHPTPLALEGLVEFCGTTLIATTVTLPQSHGLLLMPLLILSLHSLPRIHTRSEEALREVLVKSNTSSPLLQTFVKLGEDNLSALPRLLTSSQDDRLLHSLQILTAIASLSDDSLSPISRSISHILGPSGGIERWGWGILDGLTLSIPTVYYAPPNVEALLIQSGNDDIQGTIFPGPTMDHLANVETQRAMSTFFRTWGRAAGDEGLFAVEWFMGFASKGAGTAEVSALWCAARLLEGIADYALLVDGDRSSEGRQGDAPVGRKSSRLLQHARWLVKLVASLWDRDLDEVDNSSSGNSRPEFLGNEYDNQLVEFVKGMQPLEKLLDIGKNAKANNTENLRATQRILFRAEALQLLALGSSILETRFSPLLIQAIYPILYSLVSVDSFLSATAHSTLLHVARACGYASASNLLLSNFDYALGSVSRYLTRQRLDMHAPKVFVILVKLVGKDVIDRASDVVEECFERLDDYHGYRVIVEGLVEVLLEVVRAVDYEIPAVDEKAGQRSKLPRVERRAKLHSEMTDFATWFKNRNTSNPVEPPEDFGPHPRHAWGKEDEEGDNNTNTDAQPMEDGPPKLSPTQKLVQQVLNKSIYFLTHPSAVIRARVLSVLASSISTLSSVQSSLLPTIHLAWPFILNRFKNTGEEPFVVVEAAELIRALVANVGDFMDTKVWEDIWPVFRALIERLDAGDKHSALARRRGGKSSVGTESAYTTSHRLYCAILATISLAIAEVTLNDQVAWEVLLVCRRFMNEEVHEELQTLARSIYLEMAQKNADAVWLALGGAGSSGPESLVMDGGRRNADIVFEAMD
jgi:TELO2-interacting protein 1